MKITRRYGTPPAQRGCTSTDGCPDVFKLDSGDYLIIGKTLGTYVSTAEELTRHNSGVGDDEQAVVVPAAVLEAAAEDMRRCTHEAWVENRFRTNGALMAGRKCADCDENLPTIQVDEEFEARIDAPTSPAYARLQEAAKDATEAAHVHAMHGMKRVFQLCRQYGDEAIPADEVLRALGLDENANTIEGS